MVELSVFGGERERESRDGERERQEPSLLTEKEGGDKMETKF